jgi:hypothetical protein
MRKKCASSWSFSEMCSKIYGPENVKSLKHLYCHMGLSLRFFEELIICLRCLRGMSVLNYQSRVSANKKT